jgi:hypothetical protein
MFAQRAVCSETRFVSCRVTMRKSARFPKKACINFVNLTHGGIKRYDAKP